MGDMGDKWWTGRMFILMIFLSAACYSSGYFTGARAGFWEGYRVCAEFVLSVVGK